MIIMKKLSLLFLLLIGVWTLSAQSYKPYTIGAESSKSLSETKASVRAALKSEGIQVVGEYKPASDANRWVMAISSPELKKAVRTVGGYTGFAAALRVSLTVKAGKVVVAYTTPQYWGNAYFQKKYSKVSSLFTQLASKLNKALSPLGANSGVMYGSEKGMSASSLQKYHYMMGMPYFEDNIELGAFSSYSEAVNAIDAKLKSGVKDVKKVYSVELSDMQIKLYGIGLSGSNGEAKFLPTIDIGSQKHTAFLPYEMLVYKNKVYMLHGRYRIALAFPDLSMGTFMKIVSTPGNIEEMLKSIVK